MINVYFVERDENVERKPHTVTPKTYLKMSAEMEKYVYGNESTRYLREVSNKTMLAGDKMRGATRKPVLGVFQAGQTQTKLYSHRRWLEA